MYSLIANSNAEEFWVICLNRRNQVINYKMINLGGIAAVYVDIKLIIKYVILQEASSFIVCHNHPSGNLEPSESDINTTEKLISAAHVMGIPILDHIIISSGGYFSFLENGLLFTED